MKSSTFNTKSLHSRNSRECRPKLDMSNLIDSNVNLFMKLIERTRLGLGLGLQSETVHYDLCKLIKVVYV